MSKIFDSHSHYNDDAFKDDIDRVLNNIRDRGVGTVVNVGADIKFCRIAKEQAEKYDFMYFTRGIHPESADEAQNDEIIAEIEQMLSHPKAVAVGEAGLDYHYDDRRSDRVQKYAFIKQIELSNKTGKPLIIHTRDAMEPTLQILKEHRPHSRVIHCYSGSRESCKQLVKMGFYIGFTGVVTFKNARRAIESLQVVPRDRLLIETDCPYMAPVPHRGKRCDSSMLHFTAEKIGEVLGLSKDKVIAITEENAKRFFNIK